MSCAF